MVRLKGGFDPFIINIGESGRRNCRVDVTPQFGVGRPSSVIDRKRRPMLTNDILEQRHPGQGSIALVHDSLDGDWLSGLLQDLFGFPETLAQM
jgi:hypothetical protein